MTDEEAKQALLDEQIRTGAERAAISWGWKNALIHAGIPTCKGIN